MTADNFQITDFEICYLKVVRRSPFAVRCCRPLTADAAASRSLFAEQANPAPSTPS
ncbi:hypothetical protein ACFVSN_09625 [Kitasatospora sp. NPDC057904]|uniref:hypothetical protein n=1 Tax=Kitasatospora sp. NPDC057904 TaxID=3346275 RepID=UPI0036D890F6